jgi:hypothetical protein
MIYVVVTKRLIGLPLLMHIELLWGSRSFKNRGVGVELLCADCTALLLTSIKFSLYQQSSDTHSFLYGNYISDERPTSLILPNLRCQ